MPYIPQESRFELGSDRGTENAGELNYVLTCLCQDHWQRNNKNYQAFNDIIGALEGCKLELYRRMVAPYEDSKIEENGDVYVQDTQEEPVRTGT